MDIHGMSQEFTIFFIYYDAVRLANVQVELVLS